MVEGAGAGEGGGGGSAWQAPGRVMNSAFTVGVGLPVHATTAVSDACAQQTAC